MKPINSILHKFLLVYFILLNPVTRLVLCMGEDSHCAVEIVSETGKCAGASLTNHNAPPVELEELNSQDTCSPCWDLPVSIQLEKELGRVMRQETKVPTGDLVLENESHRPWIPSVFPNRIVSFEINTISTLPCLKSVQLQI